MLIWLKILSRRFYLYSQESLTATLFLSVVAFIDQHLLSTNFVWLLWCWLLINSGQHFWYPEVKNRCLDYWLIKPMAKEIIREKWHSLLLFSYGFWLMAWALWFLILGIKFSISTSMLIINTIPIILGISIIISSLSVELIANNNLLSFVIMPLIIPILIYGSGVFIHLSRNEDASHILAGYAALALINILFIPDISYRIIRQASRY